ncbi:MAG: NAD(P)-dependent oxidoreductase [Gammaproteobacteria bacterium]
MNILITGASGFVGLPILNNLIKSIKVNQIYALTRKIKDNYPKHEKLKWIEVNLNNSFEVSEIVNKNKIDVLIHLAWSDIPDFSSSKCINNLNQSINLINTVLENTECKKLLLAGSCFEYNQPFGECFENNNAKPKDYFTWSKLSLLEYLLLKSKEHDASLAWFRLFYVYGANQRQGSLLPTLYRSLIENKVPSLNTPKNANDFIYVEDVAEAFEIALHSEFDSGVYNLGTGSSTSVTDFCKTLEIIMNDNHLLTSSLIEHTKNTNQEINFYASVTKTKETFGWVAKTSLIDGLSESLKQS